MMKNVFAFFFIAIYLLYHNNKKLKIEIIVYSIKMVYILICFSKMNDNLVFFGVFFFALLFVGLLVFKDRRFAPHPMGFPVGMNVHHPMGFPVAMNVHHPMFGMVVGQRDHQPNVHDDIHQCMKTMRGLKDDVKFLTSSSMYEDYVWSER